METNYITIIDFCGSYVNIIKLTEEEKRQAESYDDFEEFLYTLEDKYGFRVNNCQWMTSETLKVYRYENGKEVSHAELGL